ncbi:MAG TPA: glycerol-3-phosphate acyltransferase [Candidatus Pacearchaeota archaeon]|nr:glycerol-3-phosphate acyltransferase [Candidatus Pacearchaeota archaeon]HQB18836.1 glycerol-3-phosphate acyltransferase [Candidatus Pacearchaeota archaeon]
MNITINYILIAIVSYIIGSIPFALICVRLLLGKDVRQFGSKNTGALNTLRVVSHEKGKKWGIPSFLLVFFLDASKAVLAVIIATHFIENQVVAMTLGTFFAILGHNYSIFLKFKGGRGAASLMGVLFYFDPIVFIGWVVIVACFMFLIEIFMGGIISKKFFKNAISEQIIGRLLGEIYALWWISILAPSLFYPTLLGTILIIIAHKDRIEKQVEKIKAKKYFND